MGTLSAGIGLPLRQCVLALALLLVSAGTAAQGTERGSASERQLKVAYLSKFASFVEWPDGAFAQAATPLVIGVASGDAIADELERALSSQAAGGRQVSVRRLRRADQVAGVHILFAGGADRTPVAEILAASRSLPVLTVTESSDAHALGSVLNFIVADQKVRFEVDLKAAALNRLRISARMLSAAYRVTPGSP